VLTANQIRSDFIKFFEERGHKFVPSSPVVPIGDETLLFTNAGMNQFKDIFLGLTSPDYSRAANSQKCIRAGGKHNDLEEVGVDTYHHTFFEMLGNWSFGDYFKAEAIEWAWQLLTDVWKMDPQRLHATYFEGDEKGGLAPDIESRDLWKRYLPKERIHTGNKKDNFWEMGNTGPCGPCSEIHYDDTPDKSGGRFVNQDNPDVIEIWNLVFIQFNCDENGKLTALPARHVDTGMGLERVARFMQSRKSNYDTDLFRTLMNAISNVTGKKYGGSETDESDIAFRVIADHLRTVTFAITDNCTPSNDGRGYVIRRILRRASRFGRVLDMHEPFIYKLIPTLTELMGDAFPEIRQRADFVSTVIELEEAGFGRTLDRGIEIFSAAAEKAEKSRARTISGEDAFQLYDTFGFPLDLTELMARERNLKVDTTVFNELMAQQQRRGRSAQKASSMALNFVGAELPATDDSLKYETDVCNSKVIGLVSPEGFQQTGSFEDTQKDIGLVLDRTCFYAEAGGQLGDTGVVSGPSWQFIVENTERIAECVIHRGRLSGGTLCINDQVEATVDKNRTHSKKNHTATHLLQWALQQILGDSVRQQGSLVCPDYLRFDFTYPKAMTAAQIKQAEQLVRDKINADSPVACAAMPIAEAKKLGAMALFGEKYGNQVRVVAIGSKNEDNLKQAFSREFCGGTHVNNTGLIGGFKIIKEESISAGIRRITALTGGGLTKYLEQRSEVIDELSKMLKVPAEQITERVQRLISENKKLAKQLKSVAKGSSSDCLVEAKKLLENCEKLGQTSLIVGQLTTAPIEQLRGAIDMLKKKAKSTAIVLATVDDDGKVVLLAGVTDDLISKGLKAGEIIKQVAPIVGGAGGGRPQMAQAGGKKPEKIPDALTKTKEIIRQKLDSA